MREKASWYWNRLRAMSPDEITHRINHTLKKQIWKRRKTWVPDRPLNIRPTTYSLPEFDHAIEGERLALLEEADLYMAGRYSILNYEYQEKSIDWHLDNQTGVRAPLTFGPDINYRDIHTVGNVKMTWEKNRHHQLTVLALAYALTKDAKYAKRVCEDLRSWIENNPFPIGVNWQSALEIGIRLLSWVWICRLLQGSEEYHILFGEQGMMWPSIYWHQWMVANHQSYGSSANNHLLGELVGLYVSALEWPYFSQSQKWRERSQARLEEEIIKQTFLCGLNKEQAFSYHIFSLEFFLIAALEGERHRYPYTATYKHWLKRSLEVIPVVTDVGGNVPRFGDADEGMAIQLRPLHSSRLDWLYVIGRSWLQANVPSPEKGKGLLAASLIHDMNRIEDQGLESTISEIGLDDAGYYILSSHRGQQDEIFCLADAGPLGYLSIAAHGHADALSFVLHVGGIPVIVDPGTYIYHADPSWRSYFRSTKAHNTIVIDDQDQSVAKGPFLWESKATTKVLTWVEHESGGTLVAEHDGYHRLPGKVTHRRTINLDGKKLYTVDHLVGEGSHKVEYRLHFAPHCRVELHDDTCIVTWGDGTGQLTIHLDDRLSWRTVTGGEDAGWYSSGFNLKEPTVTLVGTYTGSVPIEINNMMEVS